MHVSMYFTSSSCYNHLVLLLLKCMPMCVFIKYYINIFIIFSYSEMDPVMSHTGIHIVPILNYLHLLYISNYITFIKIMEQSPS
jgi:hypothetical protein